MIARSTRLHQKVIQEPIELRSGSDRPENVRPLAHVFPNRNIRRVENHLRVIVDGQPALPVAAFSQIGGERASLNRALFPRHISTPRRNPADFSSRQGLSRTLSSSGWPVVPRLSGAYVQASRPDILTPLSLLRWTFVGTPV
jgi:hypothetical protein